MTDLDKAREEYAALEWVPDGEMGFDPGGREVKAKADALIAALTARCEELERELAATEAERYRVNVQAEQAEAALAAERELLEAALHWLTSLKQDYDANGNGIRKWSDVYDECVANIKRLAACAARPATEEES